MKELDETHPNSFFDWKINVAFYVSLHAVKAVLVEKFGIETKSHDDIDEYVNPRRTSSPKINHNCFQNYRVIRRESEISRYDGFSDQDDFNEDRSRVYAEIVRPAMVSVLKYVQLNQGIDLDIDFD